MALAHLGRSANGLVGGLRCPARPLLCADAWTCRRGWSWRGALGVQRRNCRMRCANWTEVRPLGPSTPKVLDEHRQAEQLVLMVPGAQGSLDKVEQAAPVLVILIAGAATHATGYPRVPCSSTLSRTPLRLCRSRSASDEPIHATTTLTLTGADPRRLHAEAEDSSVPCVGQGCTPCTRRRAVQAFLPGLLSGGEWDAPA